jgi:ornithine carbamoyltransferase
VDDSLLGRSLLREADLTPAQFRRLIAVAAELKAARRAGIEQARLRGRKIALVFEKPSTRTRCAFEVAAYEQGAHVTYLDPGISHIGERESMEDTARVLGRLYDGIEFRGRSQASLEVLARHAGVPVWNGLTELWHPTQAIADMLTIREHSAKPWPDITVAYLGDGASNIANSLRVAGALLGMTVRVASPEAFRGDPAIIAQASGIAQETGAALSETDDINEAIRGADFLYADAWVRIGEPAEQWRGRVESLRPYRVGCDTMLQTKNPAAKFMHCLPALHDGGSSLGIEQQRETGLDAAEVTDELFRSAASVVFDQAENRMHAIKAVLVATLAPDTAHRPGDRQGHRRSAADACELEQDGFARYPSASLCPDLTEPATACQLQQITECFAHLPLDPYAPEANRSRRHSRAVYLPWTGVLAWIPGLHDDEYGFAAEFYQGHHNAEYEGVRRRFPEIPAASRDNPLLLRIIRFDLEQALWLEGLKNGPVHVGVHFVKLTVQDQDDIAVTSPDCLHQDGGTSTFTFAHLVTRRNAVGGENVIASPRCAGHRPDEIPAALVRSRFTLAEPLDTYGVHDVRVSHYVSPVRRGDVPQPGERSVILVGLTPLVPQL